MSDADIVARLRAWRDELVEATHQDQLTIRKVSTVIEDIDGVLEGEF